MRKLIVDAISHLNLSWVLLRHLLTHIEIKIKAGSKLYDVARLQVVLPRERAFTFT